jgi:G3E family GTPase
MTGDGGFRLSGCGKDDASQSLATESRGKRVAVIVNDTSELSIDAA